MIPHIGTLKGVALPACSPPKGKLKKKFVDTIIPKVLRDFRFNVNQILKSVDD
jgi:hypothetical protein